MKRYLLLGLAALFSLTAVGQKKDFYKDVQDLLKQSQEADHTQHYREVGNEFMLMYDTYPTRWEPFYYAALFHCFAAERSSDVGFKTKAYQSAEDNANRSLDLDVDQSETHVLKAYIKLKKGLALNILTEKRKEQIKNGVNRAKQMEPDNPRAHLVAAMYLFYCEEDKSGARQQLQLALDNFESFQPDSPIAPGWGKSMAEDMLSRLE